MLHDFAVMLRNGYSWSFVEFLTIIIWLVAACFSVHLFKRAKSLRGKIVLGLTSFFCVGISLVTIFIFLAFSYVNFKWHFSDSPPMVSAGRISQFKIPVYGTEDPKELALIRYALEFPEVDYIKPNSLRIFDEKILETILTFKDVEIAHAHKFKNHQNICIKKSGVCLVTLWHEMDHIDSWTLPISAINDWMNIASGKDSFEYDVSYYGKKGFPEKGLWSDYGATEVIEDIAEWRSMLYWCLHLGCHPQANPFAFIKDRNDLRWSLKLEWMFKWKRITESQYVKLKKLMLDLGFKFKP
jgi:hypothetical protein